MEIAPHVHLIPRVMATPYLIVDQDGLTLVDTGLKGSHRQILGYISRLGRAPSDLIRILVTHADVDHVGGLAALQAATGARVYASAIEARAIAAGVPTRALRVGAIRKLGYTLVMPFVKSAPARVDENLKDGQVLPILGGLRVIYTIGHTPGHVSFFSPGAGILFSGDSLVSRAGTLVGSSGGLSWDQDKANAAVRIQAALGANIVCPGHGGVVRDAGSRFPNI